MPADAQHRSGTSRQIKRAYQKAGPRVSEADIRRAQRGNELQQRAERILKAERQKKINQQKREEKEKKDREARKRMGIPEPTIGFVGPSQIRMSQFFGQEGKRKEGKAGVTTDEEPSDVAAAIANINWDAPHAEDPDADFDQQLEDICRERESATVSIGRPGSQTIKGRPSSSLLGPDARHVPEEKDGEEDYKVPAAVTTVQKSSPTSQRRIDGVDSPSIITQNGVGAHRPTHLSQAEVIVRIDEPWDEEIELVEDWNDFLVSNSQIEREISLEAGQKLPMSQRSFPISSFPEMDFTDEELSDLPSPSSTHDVVANAKGAEKAMNLRSPKGLHYIQSHDFVEGVRPLNGPSRATTEEHSKIEQSQEIGLPNQTAINDGSSDFDDSELDDLLQACPTPTKKVQQQDSKALLPNQPARPETVQSLCYALPDDFLMSTQELQEFTD